MGSSIIRRLTLVSAVAVLALAGVACDSGDTTTPTTPTTPAPTVTETFAGSLNINGAVSFTFPSSASGTVTASLRTLTPSTVQVSLALGTWNGVSCNTTGAISTDRATAGSSVTGNVSGSGTLCVRISDVGQLTGSATFEIVVVHP